VGSFKRPSRRHFSVHIVNGARQQIDHSIVKRAVAAELRVVLSIALNLLSEESQRVPTSYLRIIYCGARKRHNGCYAAMRGRYALWRYV
jgi:hypothetical protein